jgi:hypothetical protein
MARLREGGLDRLVDLIVEDLLSRQVATLLDPKILSSELSSALALAVRSPSTETWLRQKIVAGREHAAGIVKKDGRTFRQRLPRGAVQAVARLLAEPWVPDERLVERLVDHEAMSGLVREVLQGTLVGFGQRLRNLAPDPGRLAGLGAGLGAGFRQAPGMAHLRAFGSSVAAVGSGLSAAVSAELEHQLEERAKDFVAQALRSVLSDVARQLSDPSRVRAMSSWRKHAFDVVLDAEPEIWAAEVERLDPARLTRTILAVLDAFAAQPDLATQLEDAVRAVADQLGHETVRDQLRATGLEDSWRSAITAILRPRARELLDNPSFEKWIGELVDD